MEKIKIYHHHLITPDKMALLPGGKQWQIAQAASLLIAQRAGENMFTYQPKDILPYLTTGHAAAVTSPDSNKLWAFGKLYPWHFSQESLHPVIKTVYGQQPGVVELGALVVAPGKEGLGFAHLIIDQLTTQHSHLYPQEAPLVAVVVKTNLRSHQLFSQHGHWKVIDPKQLSIDLLKGWIPESDIFQFIN